nr:flagellar brake protein [Pseudomonas sp.]
MSNPFFTEEGPQPPKILSAPAEIYANLRPLQENKTPLALRFVERNQRYQSFVVELNREKGWLALDELLPADGERLMIAGEAFQVEGFYEGARISWTNAGPVHLSELDDARCYWIPLPTEITYHQRRNAFRAQPVGQLVTTTLSDNSLRTPLEGTLLDLSATGCRLSLTGDMQSRLQPGQVYEQLALRLPFGTVTSPVELRHAVFDERQKLTFCGFRFHRMSGLTQRQIERFVYQLQREARRDQTVGRFS